MEPTVTAWMLTTLLSGWLGNRTDFFLCKGANKIYNQVIQNINEPTNHHIEKAIRKSYLKSTLIIVNHILPKRKWYNLTDARWENLKELQKYIKEQISLTSSNSSVIRKTSIDHSYREILFPKNSTSSKRLNEIILNFKTSIISELESNRRKVENEVKKSILEGWNEGGKKMDFYKLTCAFFTQELKTNSKLSSFIQTEYLDTIQSEIGDIKINVIEIEKKLLVFFNEYRDIYYSVEKIHAKFENFEKELIDIPERTADIILKEIKNKSITPREITISDEYHKYLYDIRKLKSSIESLNSEIHGIKLASNNIDDNIKEKLQVTLEKLEIKLIKKSSKKNLIEDRFNAFINDIIELSKHLKNTKNISSNRLLELEKLFKKGEYQKIKNLLSDEHINTRILEFENEKKALVDEIIIKAKTILLLKDKNWFNETETLLLKSIKILETFDTVFYYASFLSQHNQADKAIKYLKKSLSLITNEEQKAYNLKTLGISQIQTNKLKKADKTLHLALDLYKELAYTKPEEYLPFLASTLNDLGILNSNINSFKKAEKFYKEAIETYKNIEESSQYLATLNNLGILYNKKNKFKKAEITFKDALITYKKTHPNVNKQKDKHLLATILNNLGNLQKRLFLFKEAEKSFNESLKIRRKLVQDNPYIFSQDLSTTLNNIGELQRIKGDYEKAEKSIKEGAKIRKNLATLEPKIHLTYLAEILDELGVLQRYKEDYKKAIKTLEESLKIRRKLAQKNPKSYLPYLVHSLNNLAIALSMRKDFKNAKNLFNEAYSITEKLVKKQPKVYLPEISRITNNLANVNEALNELDQAEKLHQISLEINRKLATKNNQVYSTKVANSLYNLGSVQSKKRDLNGAKKSYRESIKINKKLSQKNPQVFNPLIANALHNLGCILIKNKELDKAKKAFIEAIDTYSEIIKDYDKQYLLTNLSNSLNNLANVQYDLKEFEAAEQSYTSSLKIYQKLSKKKLPEHYEMQIKILTNLVILKKTQNKDDEANSHIKEIISIRKKLNFPDNLTE